MEMVIQKIGSPVADHSTRKSSIPRRWNSGTNVASPAPAANSKSSTKSLKEEPTTEHSGKSLLSFKAYYRKLRTFKGTVKALINLRCLPFSQTKHLAAPIAEAAQSSSRVASRVGKLSLDGDTLQEVQRQVESLVDGGHVVLELDREQRQSVAYRQQGDLAHYTEENVRKRLSLKDNRLMIALTQRLWVTAVQTDDQKLHFDDYEIYMLRLHRLILPEFDVVQSQELILEDWTRDSNGSDHLDYGFFHSSMFELVDLWTDTVEPEDYISLLYCIMHSLTCAYQGRYKLKELEDINPIDIVECSKHTSQEEIERDLASEMNGKDAQFYQDLATREALEDELANQSTIENGGDTLLERGADNASLSDLANAATTKTVQLLGKFSIGKGDAQSNFSDPEASKAPDPANQRSGQQKMSGPKDKHGGAKRIDDSSSRDQRHGGIGNNAASASASTTRRFLSAKVRPRKTTTFMDYGSRLRMNIVYDPSIDPSTVDGGQLSSTSPPQPIFTPPVRAQYSASSKRIHGFPAMEKLPMANSSALPSSVNHSNTVSISSDVEVYDSKTDYLKKLPSSRAIIYPHTTAYPSSSGFLQLNGAPPKISTTGHHNHDTSAPKTLDTNDIHSVIIDPNDPKAGETRPSSSPFGSTGQGRGATSPRSATYKRQLQSPTSAASQLHLKLGDATSFTPLQGRNVAKYFPSPLSAINDMHAVTSTPAEFSVSGQPVQTRGNRSSSLPEPIKDPLELISLVGTNATTPRSAASRQPSDLNLILSAVGTSPRSPSHQKQRSPRRSTARLQEGGSHRVSTPSIVSRPQQQSMNLEVQSHSLSPRKPQ